MIYGYKFQIIKSLIKSASLIPTERKNYISYEVSAALERTKHVRKLRIIVSERKISTFSDGIYNYVALDLNAVHAGGRSA